MLGSAVRFCLTVAVAYAIALAVFPAIRRRGPAGLLAGSAGAVALFAIPLLIPHQQVLSRAFAALFSVDLFFRVVDFTRQARSGKLDEVDWASYCRYLIPFPLFLVIFNLRSHRLAAGTPRAPELLRAAVGGLIFAGIFCLTLAAWSSAILKSSFLLDHAMKVGLYLVALESASQLLLGLERLAGHDTTPIVDRSYLSRTPAEFWFRYNQRVRLWLTLNVYLPCGGRRRPIRGIFMTFLVSGILHEVAFGIATSRFDGYQLAFFLLQAPAVILSRGLEQLARTGVVGDVLARVLTIAWMGATSMFFFHGLDRVFPFVYASEPSLF